MSWRWQSRYEMRFIRSKLTQTLRKKIVDSSVRKFIGHLINLSRKSGSFSLLKKQDSDEGCWQRSFALKEGEEELGVYDCVVHSRCHYNSQKTYLLF